MKVGPYEIHHIKLAYMQLTVVQLVSYTYHIRIEYLLTFVAIAMSVLADVY